MSMDRQHILVIGVETEETRKASTSIKRKAGISAIKTEGLNEDCSKHKVTVQATQQENVTEKMGYIPILIMLTTGMILQLSGNSFCVSAGLVVCVSICSLICISVFISAILYNEKSISPYVLEYSTIMEEANSESEMRV
jgi:hypothetical protein